MGALKSKFRRSKSSSRKSKDSKTSNDTGNKKSKRTINLPESQSARKTVDPRLPFTHYRQIFSIRNAWKAVQRSLEDSAMETMIRFFRYHPQFKKKYPDIEKLADDEQLRSSEPFKEHAMDMYNIFESVITNLEEVDKALDEISYDAPNLPFTHRMLEEYRKPFIETLQIVLGSDRFTEATEGSFTLLYQFVQQEVGKHISHTDEPEEPEIANGEITNVQADVEAHTEDIVDDTAVQVDLCDGDT